MPHGKEVIMFKNKIYAPLALRKRILSWYHLYLCHTGSNRLGKTIQQACDVSKIDCTSRVCVKMM